jgi:hypothetical protein
MNERPEDSPAPAKPSVDVPGGGKPARPDQDLPETPHRPVRPDHDLPDTPGPRDTERGR